MNLWNHWEGIVAVLVLWAASAGVYLFLLNRWVLMMRDHRIKLPLLLLAMALLAAGGAWYGWRAGFSPLFWVALAVLLVQTLGEVFGFVQRRALAGAPPAWQEDVAEPLLQPLTTTTLALRRYEIRPPAWRGPRLRIVHLTDLHLDGLLPDAHYRLVMERVRHLAPDLLFITGDTLSDDGAHADRLAALLDGVRGRLGSFAILGNHDYWSDAPRLVAALHAAGFQALGNGSHTLEVGGARVALWGCEDPWGPARWAPPPVRAGDLVLALSHTGDNIYRLARAGAHAVFSGHYHAGQWRLPLLGALMVPSRFGRRFDHGHFVVAGAHLFISSGIGITRIPFRLYCRPDIFIVDILPGG